MRKEKAIEHFGSITALAEALDITTQAISQWDGVVPAARAWQLQVITGGRLRVDPSQYQAKHDGRLTA